MHIKVHIDQGQSRDSNNEPTARQKKDISLTLTDGQSLKIANNDLSIEFDSLMTAQTWKWKIPNGTRLLTDKGRKRQIENYKSF